MIFCNNKKKFSKSLNVARELNQLGVSYFYSVMTLSHVNGYDVLLLMTEMFTISP